MTAYPLPALRALPARALNELAAALRRGRLAAAPSTFAIRNTIPIIGETASAEIASLLGAGLAVEHAAVLLDTIVAERMQDRDTTLELVTSGPDISGETRDTGVVLRELFAAAERRVLVVGFAVHQGREVFAALAARMHQRPDLAVRLCLDVRRAAGDTTRPEAIARRFAERFVHKEWPGSRVPNIFYDPRSLAEADTLRASLHAKCVAVDGSKALVGSANFTEAAQLRNIEVGVLMHKADLATAIERHFEKLIEHGHLLPLRLLSR